MQLTLSDAVSSLQACTDQTHKFWGYYQAVTAAAVAFAWTSNVQPPGVITGLAIAYVVFAILNCRLVFDSQRTSLVVWRSIQKYSKNHSGDIADEFKAALALNKPDTPVAVAGMHIFFSLSAAVSIVLRECQ